MRNRNDKKKVDAANMIKNEKIAFRSLINIFVSKYVILEFCIII